MMAKTFDQVWEAQELNYQFLLAQTVLTWRSQPTNPPPFNVLRLPYHILAATASIIHRIARLCCADCVAEVAESAARHVRSGSIDATDDAATAMGDAGRGRSPAAAMARGVTVGRGASSEQRVSVFTRHRRPLPPATDSTASPAKMSKRAAGLPSMQGMIMRSCKNLVAANGGSTPGGRGGADSTIARLAAELGSSAASAANADDSDAGVSAARPRSLALSRSRSPNRSPIGRAQPMSPMSDHSEGSPDAHEHRGGGEREGEPQVVWSSSVQGRGGEAAAAAHADDDRTAGVAGATHPSQRNLVQQLFGDGGVGGGAGGLLAELVTWRDATLTPVPTNRNADTPPEQRRERASARLSARPSPGHGLHPAHDDGGASASPPPSPPQISLPGELGAALALPPAPACPLPPSAAPRMQPQALRCGATCELAAAPAGPGARFAACSIGALAGTPAAAVKGAWKSKLLQSKGRAAAAAAFAMGRPPPGLYMRTPFFVAWNHKHSHEALSARLTESILRHENDFMQEGRPRAKVESIEGLVTLHIKELEVALGRKMGQIAAEHAEQLAEVQMTQQGIAAQLTSLLEAIGHNEACASSTASSPVPRGVSPTQRVLGGADASLHGGVIGGAGQQLRNMLEVSASRQALGAGSRARQRGRMRMRQVREDASPEPAGKPVGSANGEVEDDATTTTTTALDA